MYISTYITVITATYIKQTAPLIDEKAEERKERKKTPQTSIRAIMSMKKRLHWSGHLPPNMQQS
jgi:hypothetical protein